MNESIHKTGVEKVSHKSKPKKHLQVMIGIRMSKELRDGLDIIKKHYGLINDSEGIRVAVKKTAKQTK